MNMLQTRHAPVADQLVLAPGVALALGRAHEVAGPARAVLAQLVAARLLGPVLWLQPAWASERPMGDGIRGFLDPGRLVFARARSAADILWAAEEALRSGQVALVVAELPEPPAMTPVRRLHLAAEAGAARGVAPLALLLTPGQGGAPGVETRWHLAPLPGWVRGAPRWRLVRARARLAPEAAWEMRIEAGRLRLEAPAPA
jgi:protein ImuA